MRRSIVVSSLMVLALHASAQQRSDTTLKSTTIEVLQSYKPEVKQAPKPDFKPDVPPRDTSRPAFKYDVPQQALSYTYSSLPLRPLALGKDSTKLPFQNYLKLGGGNLSTICADAGIGYSKENNYETSLHLHHLSQNGNIKNQKIALSGIETEGTLHSGDHALRLSLEGMRNQYHFYGYNHALLELGADSVKQTYTGVRAAFDVKNERVNKLGINYHPKIGIDYYTDANQVSERTLFFDVPFSKNFDTSLTLSVGVRGAFTTLSGVSREWTNNTFQFTPQLSFQKNGFSGRAGLYPTLSNFYDLLFLPDIEAAYRFASTQFTISAGWKADLRQNTFRQLTTYNPYLFPLSTHPSFSVRQTRTEEIFGKLSTGIGNHFTVSGKLSWWQLKHLPMFLNNTHDRKNFYLVYDSLVNAISFEASIRYQVANRFSIGATGVYTSFGQKTFSRVWHEPGMRIKADLMLHPIPDLTITAYAIVLDQIYALNELNQEVKLSTALDAGAGAEYQFIPRLSAFINVNNVFNNRYQRWYGYETFGINVFGGLRFKF
ncbi:MAG TPA: hypothetical protein PL009_14430 [Flavipsychrobacter sp.]|nr:hypothetical protein [Flavipsychrobacter sp.]